MNKIRRFLVLAGLLSVWLSSPGFAAAAKTPMQEYVEAMQPGWNLGNTLDAIPTETSWGNPLVTQAFIEEIAAQGFKSIRIPVTWNNHIGPASSYTIDPAWIDRVQQIVDWSLEAGLYVMLNMHHDSDWIRAMPTDHDAVLARYTAVWSQIAPRFRDHPNQLMLESINEPDFDGVSDATKMTLLDELNTTFFNIVRGSGGGNATRPLVLPTVVTNAGQQFLDSLNDTIASLDDPNLIATVHYYGFWPFSVNIAGSTKFDAESIDNAVTAMDAVYETFVSQGIPVIVGEYGLLGFDNDMGAIEHGEMLKYFEFFTQYARSKGVTHQVWDNGQHFNRATFQWRDPDLYAVIIQSATGRSSTAATDLIYLKSGAPVEDAVIKLNLNGNTFVSLHDGGTPLVPGTDYSVSGDVLTIRAQVLSPYASGPHGVKTVLTAHFDSGPAWKFHVRHYNSPVLLEASGTTNGGLVIPVAFRGDLVATMEARYGTSGFPYPGPHEWTQYKQFNDAYRPHYTNNTITITPAFFAETASGTVNLTFHFWSGHKLTYPISIVGSAVSGQTVFLYPDYDWAAFTTGVAGSWTPPDLEPLGPVTYTATGLPAWASINATTGEITGTAAGAPGSVVQATVVASANGATLATTKVNIAVASPGSDVAPVSLSTRGRTGRGSQVLIPGIAVGGSSPATFLIRAVGPKLAGPPFNVSDTVPDPMLSLMDFDGNVLFSNDNWGESDDVDALGDAFKTAGAFSLDEGSLDAALLVTLQPGSYTAHASGVGGTTGVALVEVYELTGASTEGALLSISTRAFVGTGDDVLIPGIGFRGGGTRRLLIRAVGPTLEPFGVDDFLSDPRITIVRDGVSLATNDDWGAGNDVVEITTVAASVGAFGLPEDSRDAVLLTTMPEGLYTVVVSGSGGTTGVALVEVYVVP